MGTDISKTFLLRQESNSANAFGKSNVNNGFNKIIKYKLNKTKKSLFVGVFLKAFLT